MTRPATALARLGPVVALSASLVAGVTVPGPPAGAGPAASSVAGVSAAPSAPALAVRRGGSAPPAVALIPVAQLDAPMAVVPRAGTDDLYAAERAGLVRHLVPAGGGFSVDPSPVLDLTARTTTDGERGLLGLAFSPDGTRLYVHHTSPLGDTRLVEYTMAGDQAVAASRRVLLRVAQPFPNHNGGQVAVGPDGKLYLGLGDGGAGGDPLGNGQDTSVVLGKILRLDPRPGARGPYTVPRTNPFVAGGPAGAATRPEIWLYGVRNPWRFSFDRATGALWIGDVGQDTFEEVDRLPPRRDGRGAGRGANLGWSRMEGDQPFAGGTEPANHTGPLFTYPHGLNNQNGCAVIGGYVYRGAALPDLQGTYVYGDLCRAELRGLRQRSGQVTAEGALGVGLGGAALVGFAEDAAGELYTLGDDGVVSRIEPAG